MIRLPGNPFSQQFDEVEGSLETEAIMALAFEQRTANLMQAASHGIATDEGDLERIRTELRDRLGLADREASDG